MAANVNLVSSRVDYKNIIFDILALTFIYFVPALSHLFNIPIYLVEPMRIMLILAMVHTSKRNAFLIALTLPLFSFLISSHPNIFKGLIMTAELVLNVWLFFEISKQVSNQFVSMISAIVISKLVYYLMKFGLISFAILESGLISTPIYLQVITSIFFSGYVYIVLRRQRAKSDQAL
jgi:hypothetical protein